MVEQDWDTRRTHRRVNAKDKNTGNDNWGRRLGVLLGRSKRNGDRKDGKDKDKTQTRIRSVSEMDDGFYLEVGIEVEWRRQKKCSDKEKIAD